MRAGLPTAFIPKTAAVMDASSTETGATAGDPGEVDGVAHAMMVVSRVYYEALAAALADAGFGDLNPAGIALLARIDAGGSRPSHLAANLLCSKQAASHSVRELQLHGYVNQIRDPRDGRARLIVRSERGAAAIEAGLLIKKDLRRLASEAIGEDVLSRLGPALAALADAIRSHSAGNATSSGTMDKPAR